MNWEERIQCHWLSFAIIFHMMNSHLTKVSHTSCLFFNGLWRSFEKGKYLLYGFLGQHVMFISRQRGNVTNFLLLIQWIMASFYPGCGTILPLKYSNSIPTSTELPVFPPLPVPSYCHLHRSIGLGPCCCRHSSQHGLIFWRGSIWTTFDFRKRQEHTKQPALSSHLNP